MHTVGLDTWTRIIFEITMRPYNVLQLLTDKELEQLRVSVHIEQDIRTIRETQDESVSYGVARGLVRLYSKLKSEDDFADFDLRIPKP